MHARKTRTAGTQEGIEIPTETFTRLTAVRLCLLLLAGFTVWVWLDVITTERAESAVYFLDVGQGDSQLLVLSAPNGRSDIKVLIDGGRGRAVLHELADILGRDRYIDILMMSHPHADHYAGFIDVLEQYDVGMFISNGDTADTEVFAQFTEQLEASGVPAQTLARGDRIQYGDHVLEVLMPDQTMRELDDPDEASLVVLAHAHGTRILFTGDIGFPAERALLAYDEDISADILKIGHHGSAGSTDVNFVAAVDPDIAVIGVGNNRFGHPADRVLDVLELAGVAVYRTDHDGTVRIPLRGSDDALRATHQTQTGILSTLRALFSGSYRHDPTTNVLLDAHNRNASMLVPYHECAFEDGTTADPRAAPIVFNEIAWMGAESGATHEWIELRRTSGEPVDISGWQLLNENERIHITFPQQTVFEQSLLILARAAADEALELNADLLYTGSIRNSTEGLRLFDNTCRRIDEALADPAWPAGNNDTKQTMERTNAFEWEHSAEPGGTPGHVRTDGD